MNNIHKRLISDEHSSPESCPKAPAAVNSFLSGHLRSRLKAASVPQALRSLVQRVLAERNAIHEIESAFATPSIGTSRATLVEGWIRKTDFVPALGQLRL